MNPSMAPKRIPRQTNGDVKRDLNKLAAIFRNQDFETYIKNGETLVLTDDEVFPRTDTLAIPAVENKVDRILRSSGIKGAYRTHANTVTASEQDHVLVQIYVQIKPVNGFD